MKALISVNDYIMDYEDNQGQRILEIVEDDAVFPVHSDMTWIDCPGLADGSSEGAITSYKCLYWYKDNAFSLIPVDPNPVVD
jgi:hypothetical protein